MEHNYNLASRLENRLVRLPPLVLAVLAPFLGLIYITIIPTFAVLAVIYMGGKHLVHRLSVKPTVPAKHNVLL